MINTRESVPQVAIATSTAAIGAGLEPFISLGLGLVGVILARIAFTTRQQRLGERVGLLETIVITGMAMLIVGPLVWEHRLGLTTSAMLGLGAGWASIAIFDALGERIVDMIVRLTGGSPRPRRPSDPPSGPERPDPRRPLGGPLDALPHDMVDSLERMDQAEDRRRHDDMREQRRTA